MKKFDIPERYISTTIKEIHRMRNAEDRKKRDLRPTLISSGNTELYLARSFGFCYGVENAVERSYRALAAYPDKKIYLLSQMIHNPDVNADLIDQGMRFIQDTEGNLLIPWETITSDDIVIIPAFGTPLETLEILKEKGIETDTFDTTCPFVTRVWKRSEQLGKQQYNIVIHGKSQHEETKATFSHANVNGEVLVIRNLDEAQWIERFLRKEISKTDFMTFFRGKHSSRFDPEIHLQHIGVVNQTTMLATETTEITTYLTSVYKEIFGAEYKSHIADTRDTLCYATNENQDATNAMLLHNADVGFVVGGYNSSNTSHLVDLSAEKVPTFFINNATSIADNGELNHFDYAHKKELKTQVPWLTPNSPPMRFYLTSGASCPDTVLESVLHKILSLRGEPLNTSDLEAHISIPNL